MSSVRQERDRTHARARGGRDMAEVARGELRWTKEEGGKSHGAEIVPVIKKQCRGKKKTPFLSALLQAC